MPFRLETRLWLPAPIDRVFAFFADAKNLETITPSFLHFRLLTPDIEMRRGATLDCRLRLHGVPFRWRSEITAATGVTHICSGRNATARSSRTASTTTCPAATRSISGWSAPT